MKWNNQLRTLMYKRLLEKYGPYSKWETKGYPKKGKYKDYQDFCKEIADGLSLLTGKNFTSGGVENQIAWSSTNQEYIKKTKVHYQNVAVALETGFISTKDLSKTMLKEKN